MKARTFLLLFASAIISINLSAQEISEKQKKFVNSFVEAVSKNNQKKVIKMMDKDYRKEQLEGNLEGNKEQFVNELFGGEDLLDQSIYVNIKLNEIIRFEVAEVIPLKGGTDCNYIFRVRNGVNDILSTLILRKRGKKFGFVGAYG